MIKLLQSVKMNSGQSAVVNSDRKAIAFVRDADALEKACQEAGIKFTPFTRKTRVVKGKAPQESTPSPKGKVLHWKITLKSGKTRVYQQGEMQQYNADKMGYEKRFPHLTYPQLVAVMD